MIVVSDTTAITNLLAIDRADLLREVFGEVFVPTAVARELLAAHPSLPDFLHSSEAQDREAVRALVSARLDQGEAEAIVLTEELDADFLLIDESDGRALARQRGLAVIGLIGVLRRAKNDGLIPAMAPIIRELETTANFWISATIRNQALADAGELPP